MAADGAGALAMADAADAALVLRPAPVAIHDDGDVSRQAVEIDEGHGAGGTTRGVWQQDGPEGLNPSAAP